MADGVGDDGERPDLERLTGLVLGDRVGRFEEAGPLGDRRGEVVELVSAARRQVDGQRLRRRLAPREAVAQRADVDPVIGVEVADEQAGEIRRADALLDLRGDSAADVESTAVPSASTRIPDWALSPTGRALPVPRMVRRIGPPGGVLGDTVAGRPAIVGRCGDAGRSPGWWSRISRLSCPGGGAHEIAAVAVAARPRPSGPGEEDDAASRDGRPGAGKRDGTAVSPPRSRPRRRRRARCPRPRAPARRGPRASPAGRRAARAGPRAIRRMPAGRRGPRPAARGRAAQPDLDDGHAPAAPSSAASSASGQVVSPRAQT